MIALESGSAIWKKNLAWVQPSISAASYSSSEMFDLKKVLATIMLYTLKHPGRISAQIVFSICSL